MLFSLYRKNTGRQLLEQDKFVPRRLETADHYFAGPLMQFVAQGKIVVAMLPQEQAGKAKSGARLGSPGIMGPEIGREKPGPTKRFSTRNRIDCDRFSARSFPFQDDRSGFDEIKAAGWFAFAQNELAGVKLSRRYTKSQKLDVTGTHSLQKGMGREALLDTGIAG
ncbi:MAG: hypothetical protein QOG27_876 [Verrucomicrobiota bacterium]